MSKTISVKVPGKLMVAGEYAVLEPNQQLIVTAVDRFVFASIQLSNENLLTLENFGLQNLKWYYSNRKINLDVEDKRTSFVREAMATTLAYLEEQSHYVQPFTLTINSELDDHQSGLKYGLGSSAAVVTAVVTSILTKFLKDKPTAQLIFRLAAIAHVKTQGSGSGADIAASTFGGVLQYSSFQADWLLQKLQTKSLTELIKAEWTYLSVKQLDFPTSWEMSVGWTGRPASTTNLVDQILMLKDKQPEQFQTFINGSKIAVEMILKGIEQRDVQRFNLGIKQNRNCLATLGKHAQIAIETPLLKTLSDIADDCGGAGKLSGAGGGDCGIAFSTSTDQVERMKDAWEYAGIKPLQITTYPDGATKLNSIR